MSRRRTTDTPSLMFGMMFLGLAGWWWLMWISGYSFNLDTFAWLAAVFLLVVGVVGVLSAIRSSRNRNSTE